MISTFVKFLVVKPLALFAALSIAAQYSFASVDIYELLNRMSHSDRELSYQGVLSYQQGNKLHSFRIAHTVVDGEEFERLEYMDGRRRDVVRRGHNLECIHPGHQLIRVLSDANPQTSATSSGGVTSNIEKYYKLTLIGRGRVADRSVVELLLSPRDNHRYVHRISLDEETGLLLKSTLIDGNRQILERFQYVDITIGQKIPLEFFDSGEFSHRAPHVDPLPAGEELSSLNKKEWHLKWLPQGYKPVLSVDEAPNSDMATFTDGLAVFSVFLERASEAELKTRAGHTQRGATTAYSKPLLLAGRPHRVTVVGEIPFRTAQQIAQSVFLLTAH